jgi:hypothetical protein
MRFIEELGALKTSIEMRFSLLSAHPSVKHPGALLSAVSSITR